MAAGAATDGRSVASYTDQLTADNNASGDATGPSEVDITTNMEVTISVLSLHNFALLIVTSII